MNRIYLAFALLMLPATRLLAQICEATGNVIIYSNYEGGVLNINVDQNIPNLKIGVCTYEAVQINLTGPFVGNITEILYAGYDGPNNSNCSATNIPTTSVTGALAPGVFLTKYSASTGQVAVATHLGDPILPGFPPLVNCMVGADGACDNNASGGGNASPQIVQFFLTEFGPGSSLFAHFTDYSCFSGTYAVSAGGNCCLQTPVTPPNPIYVGGLNYNFIGPTQLSLCNGPVTINLTYPVLVQPPIYPGYVWSDGQTGPTATFTQPGIYSFTVGDYCHTPGVTPLLTDTIEIISCCTPPPAPAVTGAATYCQGDPIAPLTATPGGTGNPDSLAWFSDPGLISQVASGNTLIPTGAVGIFTFYVSERNGVCPSPATPVSFTVNPRPTANAGPDRDLCPNAAGVTLTGSGGVGYSWSPVNSLSNPAIAAPVANPAVTTSYVLSVTSAAGCADTDTVIVTVLPPVQAAAGNDTAICAGASVRLNASGGLLYSWSPAGGLSNPGVQNPVATPTDTTAYVVRVTNAAGCIGTDTVVISVLPPPAVDAGGPYYVCALESVTLRASGAARYEWSPPFGLNNTTIAAPVANPLQTSVYRVTGTSAEGCVATDSATVFVAQRPLTVVSGDARVCEGEAVNIIAFGGTAVVWSNGATTRQLQFVPTQNQWLVATANVGGCEGRPDSIFVEVSSPVAEFTASPDSGFAPFAPVISNTSAGAGSFSWSWGANRQSNDTLPEIVFQEPGEYTIRLVVTAGGCADTATRVVVVEEATLFIPDAFTPNGDDFNDLFTVGSYGIDSLDFQVFNVWGDKVFETTQPAFSWNGESGGKACQEGVYYFVARGIAENKRLFVRRGSITLIR